MLDLFFHELYIGYNVFVRCIFEEDLKQIQKFDEDDYKNFFKNYFLSF